MIRILALLCFTVATPAAAQQATSGTGAELRILDKATGLVLDATLARGQSQEVGYLRITLEDCRYPAANPSGDAFAEVSIWSRDIADPIFTGWLIASSPALHAMDHPRYDVWALRCTTS